MVRSQERGSVETKGGVCLCRKRQTLAEVLPCDLIVSMNRVWKALLIISSMCHGESGGEDNSRRWTPD